MENLLSNAIRHTPRGESIEIRAATTSETVRLEVADRGEWIPPELKEALFQKFGPTAAAPGSPRKGYGLGLYLVRLVAEAHGGSASVADRKGGGAVFALTLPHRLATV